MFFAARPLSVATPPPSPSEPPRQPTWGPAFWTFFHVLAEQLPEDRFAAQLDLRLGVFDVIQRICTHLPCRECRAHASMHMAGTQWSDIVTKQDLRLYLFFFHEKVTQRKSGGAAPAFSLHLLEAKYGARSISLSAALDAFCVEMARRVPDMSYIHENTERANTATYVRQWVSVNLLG